MPKKKQPESQAEQSARFLMGVEKLARDGELNHTEAEAAFEKLMGRVKTPKSS